MRASYHQPQAEVENVWDGIDGEDDEGNEENQGVTEGREEGEMDVEGDLRASRRGRSSRGATVAAVTNQSTAVATSGATPSNKRQRGGSDRGTVRRSRCLA